MEQKLLTVEDLKDDPEITTYLQRADEHLQKAGLTEHGVRHASLVSSIASNVMRRLNKPTRQAELAAIAGYLHDVGNVVNRHDHESMAAVLAHHILRERGLSVDETCVIAGAIGNHEERAGRIVNEVGAALILADKSDVHRSRVRASDPVEFDIHDRVNYAAENSFLDVNKGDGMITLRLSVDTDISPVMDYFEIFITRMIMSRRAAVFLGQQFAVEINGMRML